MAWWQKKLLRYGLRYGLSRTGLLDDSAIDLDNLDITVGRQNVIELKDVGLNIERIGQLVQLPPAIRLETARVMLLKLIIPADFYQSSIVVEIDGIDFVAAFEESVSNEFKKEPERRSRSPETARTPQHRKTNRRIHPRRPYDQSVAEPGEVYLPNVQDVARSFLLHEPLEEIRDLEALAYGDNGVDESFVSESSEGEAGTGTGVGVPGFLTSFLQGIVERFQLQIKNIELNLRSDAGTSTEQRIPITLRLRISTCAINKADSSKNMRKVSLEDISLDLLSEAELVAGLWGNGPQSTNDDEGLEYGSQTAADFVAGIGASAVLASKSIEDPDLRVEAGRYVPLSTGLAGFDRSDNGDSLDRLMHSAMEPQSSSIKSPTSFVASASILNAANSAGASGNEHADGSQDTNDFEIQAGDDNISWGSRRSKKGAPSDDLWRSMISEDDLRESSRMPEDAQSAASDARSLRSNSPFAVRHRRTVSPYERSIVGPGSWPNSDTSAPRHEREGFRSWPIPNRTTRSAIEPANRLHSALSSHEVDNKLAALGKARSASPEPDIDTTADSPPVMDDSMLESQVFSHDQAESMYMSALTGSKPFEMPGGWTSGSLSSAQTVAPDECHSVEDQETFALRPDDPQVDGAQAKLVPHSVLSTPRAQSPAARVASPRNTPCGALLAKVELLYLDSIAVTLPGAVDSDPDVESQPDTDPNSVPPPARGMPGTFSAYSELSSSRRNVTEPIRVHPGASVPTIGLKKERSLPSRPIHIAAGSAFMKVDVPTCRVLYSVTTKVKGALQASSNTFGAQERHTASKPAVPLVICLQSLQASLTKDSNNDMKNIRASSSAQKSLLNICCDDIRLRMDSAPSLSVGNLNIRLGGHDLFQFDHRAESIAESLSLSDQAPALSIEIEPKTLAAERGVATEISLQSKPFTFTLNVGHFEEVFDSFGGLSGILELGNSVLSESGQKSPAPADRPKGVRFAGEQSTAASGGEVKLNARIGGMTVDLRAGNCTIVLRTSTVKTIYREHGMVATLSRIILEGPQVSSESRQSPLVVDVATTRVEYLMTPQDKDLERLLSLLVPSRDKYDDDGDILIDTLLRQRRKGALLRVAIGDVKARLDDLGCLDSLASLGDELTKLSAVTKYLPEDDKPGMLTLVRVKDAEARVPINAQFGSVFFALEDLHLAHVGLPALFACSVGDVLARQIQGPDLFHSLLPLPGAENLPVLMARMIGNEAEPTVKIKLYNLCVEYSVPILLSLTGLNESSTPKDLMNDIAQSLANLATAETPRSPSRSPASDLSNMTARRTSISLLIHDSAVGLTPQGLPSKVLVLLKDVHSTTVVPASEVLTAKVEVRNAAVLLTDRVRDDIDVNTKVRNTHTTHHVEEVLNQSGFVSIASIMSAVVNFRSQDGCDLDEKKAINVDVKNELFLLETCADSTQTLFATLGALAPPSAPSAVPKYLTQPMPIEDMMASFSGEPFVQADVEPETLFDVEHDTNPIDAQDLLGVSMFDDTDDLLAESDMTSSLYGPVSGILDMDPAHDGDGDDLDNAETAESLLEEDPFEMTMSPEDAHLSDSALMRDLQKQCRPAISNDSVDLDPCEIEDLGFDALGSGQQALGTHHRFNAPFVSKRKRHGGMMQRDIPFKLQLRDFHLIWHLHDGYDWQRTRDGIVDAVEQVEQRAEERKARRRVSRQDAEDNESVIGDFLFNSIYIGIPADFDGQDLRRQINRGIDLDISETESIPVSGISRPTAQSTSTQPRHRKSQRRRLKLGRSRNHKIAFELKGVSADVLVFDPGSCEVVSSVDLRIKDFEIFDKVPTSTWRKFLTHLDNDPLSREMSKPMFHIQLDNVKTLESHSASEIVIHVTVLPLRLHVDQDALDFITRFFEFKDPEMITDQEPGEKPFLQRVEVETVDLCLDYKPKKVDYAGLRSGRTKEFMNFVTLEGCNIRLKHAIIYGLQGFDLLHDTLSAVWTPDVIRNQLPRVLSGLAPVRSLVNLGVGVRDVVAIPIREYKKDGRIVRSIQKGAFHFGKTTASELARLGAKVALGTQTMLSNAEEFLAPGSSTAGRSKLSTSPGWHDAGHLSDEGDPERQRAVSAYANQPLGVLSGLRSARRHLEHDLLTAKDALIAVQGEVLESRGPGDVAGAVAKHAPTVILRPVIGATRAVGTALLGVGNAVDRGNLRKVDDKYKRR